jgi:hypothetical protein
MGGTRHGTGQTELGSVLLPARCVFTARSRVYNPSIGEHVIRLEFRAMTINLTPEQEKIVKEELESGHFRTAEELISQALQALRATAPSSGKSGNNGRQREAVREMMEFVEKNRTSLQGISVKELIHEGHRL